MSKYLSIYYYDSPHYNMALYTQYNYIPVYMLHHILYNDPYIHGHQQWEGEVRRARGTAARRSRKYNYFEITYHYYA